MTLSLARFISHFVKLPCKRQFQMPRFQDGKSQLTFSARRTFLNLLPNRDRGRAYEGTETRYSSNRVESKNLKTLLKRKVSERKLDGRSGEGWQNDSNQFYSRSLDNIYGDPALGPAHSPARVHTNTHPHFYKIGGLLKA